MHHARVNAHAFLVFRYRQRQTPLRRIRFIHPPPHPLLRRRFPARPYIPPLRRKSSMGGGVGAAMEFGLKEGTSRSTPSVSTRFGTWQSS